MRRDGVHPINRVLGRLGVRLARADRNAFPTPAFLAEYRRNFEAISRDGRGFRVFKDLRYDVGDHPENYIGFECSFAAFQLSARRPTNVLDIGSYRTFVLGLLAYYDVTTIDIRTRKSVCSNETVLTSDAKRLELPSDSFDAIVSMCAVEHFGLGRYGDPFDPDADRKAVAEMVRVLRPGGHLIFTTTVTRAEPSIAFNAHRIYSMDMIRSLCAGLTCVNETFYSHEFQAGCAFKDVTTQLGVWDVYCGCWSKA